jgi:hypothetical protein
MLWRMLEVVEPAQQAELVPYVCGHLDRWPDALRLAPEHWSERAFVGQPGPLWSLARAAALTRWRLFDTELIALSRQDALASLSALALDHNQLGEDGLRALAHSAQAVGLRAVSVRHNPLGPTGVRGLAQLAGLEEVDLGWTRCGVRGLRYLVRGQSAGSLRVVRAAHDELYDDGLAQMGGLTRLESLELPSNNLGAGAVQQLAAQPPARLRALDLSENALGDEGARWLVDLMLRSALEIVVLAATGLGAAGLRALLHAPSAAQLTALDVSRNRLGSEAGQLIAEATHVVKLERLALQACGLTWPGVQALATAPQLASLRVLDLSYNAVGPQGARALADSPYLSRLERLVVDEAAIGVEGVRALARSPHAACRAAIDAQRRWVQAD